MVNTASPEKNGTSVIAIPKTDALPGESLVISYATFGDGIPAWGYRPAMRDIELRNFWPAEPLLASAIYSTVSKYVGFGWSLEGPARTTRIMQEILQGVEFGKGWLYMLTKVLVDYFTQDNGAFIEVIRAKDDPTSPCITLNHLDSALCYRTGIPSEPVVYKSLDGKLHRLKWYQVISLEEFPSPITRMHGMQYCAVTRMLRAAQVMRDIGIYKQEKISGRFVRAIHLVGGVQRKQIDDAIVQQREHSDNQGLTRYIQPLVIAALDPTARVTHETIEMASLPDGFDEESYMKWYITNMALATGQDYQDFAPLPAGNLGTSQQSQILHLKSRGKGPALFMKMFEHVMNFQGILPQNVRFLFGEQDTIQDTEKAQLRKLRAESRAAMLQSGEITPEVARQIAYDDGDLTEAQLQMMGETNRTPDETVSASNPAAANLGTTLSS